MDYSIWTIPYGLFHMDHSIWIPWTISYGMLNFIVNLRTTQTMVFLNYSTEFIYIYFDLIPSRIAI
jgi:hypothetical protein